MKVDRFAYELNLATGGVQSDTKNVKATKLYQVQSRLVNFRVESSGYELVPKKPTAPAWTPKCTLGNEVPRHKTLGTRGSNSFTEGFPFQSDLELIRNVNAAASLQSLPQLRRYTSKTVLQSHFDINGVKPLLWITFPFPNAAVGPADRWPAWHMKHISPLIFFGTV